MNFCKYEAAGNDFILVQGEQQQNWQELCHRRLGIGADGVIFLLPADSPLHDFKMRYLNADGGEVNMCGNGLRAITHFAFHELKLRPKFDQFFFKIELPRGVYHTHMQENEEVRVEMTEIRDWGSVDWRDVQIDNESYLSGDFLNTGVPHLLLEVKNLEQAKVYEEGRRIRFLTKLFPEGTNVNFFQILAPNKVSIRTYERGVEDETLACGTGVTALGHHLHRLYAWEKIEITSKGGILIFEKSEKTFLTGPVRQVFKGNL